MATTAKATAKTARRSRVDLMDLWRRVQSAAVAARIPGTVRKLQVQKEKSFQDQIFLPLHFPRFYPLTTLGQQFCRVNLPSLLAYRLSNLVTIQIILSQN